MLSIAHTEVKEIAAVAKGDFSFVTIHTRKGTLVHWTYYKNLADYGGTK